jgi:4-amino-4-deoxy-L-arabinose transferase-like glycosyltransferase
MRLNQFYKYIAVFLIAFSLAILFIWLDVGANNLEGDAAIYFRIAKNIVSGNGFSDKGIAPFTPTMVREPLYPLFLAVIFYLFSGSIFAVQLIQALLYGLTCILTYKIISYCGLEDKFSFRASLAIALFPTLANYCAYIFTEVLFTFLLALTILFLIKALKSNSNGLYFAAGSILAVASLCKAVLLFYVFFSVLLISVNYPHELKSKFIITALKRSLLLLAGFTLAVSPWITRNYLIFGKAGISLRGFNSLYARASKLELTNKELKMYALYCVSEEMANKFYPGYNLNSVSSGYFYLPLLEKEEEARRLGISQEDTDSLLKKESVSLIKEHPWRFVVFGIFEIVKLNSFSQVVFLNTDKAAVMFNKTVFLSALRGALKLLGFLIFILALLGPIFAYRLKYVWSVLFSVILYFNFIYFFFDSVGRYAAPIIPYYIFFAALVFRGKKCAE